MFALYKVLADGRRQIVGFAYAADVIGLGIDHDHVMSAQAIKPTLLRCMPVETLHRCATQDPMLGFQLYVAVARELAATRELMLTTGQRSAAERVASFLLALSRRTARSGQDRADLAELELPMTRGDIGDFLGLTIETVSRTFTRLRTLGLIELPHSNRVRLLSVERLEMLAAGVDKQGWHVAPRGGPCGSSAAACVSAPASNNGHGDAPARPATGATRGALTSYAALLGQPGRDDAGETARAKCR